MAPTKPNRRAEPPKTLKTASARAKPPRAKVASDTKDPGKKYPLCLDGARACPPEDVGGAGGYEEFLEAIRDKTHEERAAMFEWVCGWFDPEEFDPEVATKSMRKGLPDWREME